MNSYQNTLCTHRWGYSVIDFGKNQARTCCRTKLNTEDVNQLSVLKHDYFLNTKYQLERRLEMLQGIRHKSCETCWLLEDQNFQSPRRYGLPSPWKVEDNKLINLNTKEETLIEDITIEHPVLRSVTPYMLEVNLSNHCDMSCLYCSPMFSSTWASTNTDLWAKAINPDWNFGPDDAKKLKLEVNDQNLEDFNSAFWDWFKNIFDSYAQEQKPQGFRLGILGGEPVNNPRLPQFIDNICDIIESIPVEQRPHSGYWDFENKQPFHPHKPLVWFVTNGNTRESHFKKFVDRLPRLCELFTVEVSLSIESYKQRAEYIRMNLDWNRFESNVRKYLSLDIPTLQIGFQTSINNLCLSSMPDFLRWVVELYDTYNKPIFLKPNVVNDPDHYRVEMLPESFMKYISESIEILKTRNPKGVYDPYGTWTSYSTFLATLKCEQKGDWKQYEKLRDFLHSMDIRRNLDCRDVFPEMWEFWNLIQGIDNEEWAAIQEMMND